MQHIYHYLSSFDLEDSTALQKLNKRHYQYIVSAVKKWQGEAIYADHLGEKGVMESFLLKLTTELKKDASVPTSEIPITIQACADKVLDVLNGCENQDMRLSMLKKISRSPSSEVLKYLRYSTTETLKEQAKIFLPSDS